MRKFIIKPGSKELIEFICNRDNITYEMTYDSSKNLYYMIANISRSRFKEILEDVKCEIARKDAMFPVYSARTFANPLKLRRLMDLNGTNKFSILIQDRNRVEC